MRKRAQKDPSRTLETNFDTKLGTGRGTSQVYVLIDFSLKCLCRAFMDLPPPESAALAAAAQAHALCSWQHDQQSSVCIDVWYSG